MTPRLSRLLACCAVACIGGTGCAGTTRAQGTLVYGYPAVYVETVPAYTVYQPRVYYRGRYAYLADGRWYYPGERGWVVFREEPRELRRYRVNSRDPAPYQYKYRTYQYPTTPEYRYRTPEYGSPSLRPPPETERRYRRPY
jgi:hypothetical protein